MESIVRDVKSLDSHERRVYESVLGHALQENQRVIIGVIEPGGESDAAIRRAAMGRAVEIARQGRAAVESQGVTSEEAGQAIDETIRAVRRATH